VGRRLIVAALLSLPAGATAQDAPAAAILRGKVPSQPYIAYEVRDVLGRAITGYLSERQGTTLRPLIVYVHGSGHQSHFQRVADRTTPANGHATLTDVARGVARVLIVEKPGVMQYDDGNLPPSDAFRREHTLDRWVEAVVAMTRAIRRLPDVDTPRLLIVGHSEGGLVAARVAARLPEASHVALLAGGGPTQLFDILQFVRTGTFFSHISPDPATRVAYVLAQWDSIRADPESPTRDFFGHPFRRWASFLGDSPIAALRATRAAVFLAQGEDDQAVTREAFDMLAAELLAAGRIPDLHMVAGADHSFHRSTAPQDGWSEILVRIRDWYLSEVHDRESTEVR
jgi:dienelactone hydrolase